MNDLREYVAKRKAIDAKFAKNYEEGLENFMVRVLKRQTRETSVITHTAGSGSKKAGNK